MKSMKHFIAAQRLKASGFVRPAKSLTASARRPMFVAARLLITPTTLKCMDIINPPLTAQNENRATTLVRAVTPELLTENAEKQNEYRTRATSPFDLIDNPKAAERARAASLAQNYLMIAAALRADLTRGLALFYKDEMRDVMRREIDRNKDAAAACFATLGEFQKACDLSTMDDMRELYRAYLSAESQPDEAWCEHEQMMKSEKGKPINNYYREFSFYSESYGGEIAMLRCNVCGFRNATHLPADLKKMSETRKAATK